MKKKIIALIKKVVITMVALVTVAASVVEMPAVVHAADFNGRIVLEDLPMHPTGDMDINLIKNAYKVGGELGTNTASGTVVYINSIATTGLDVITPQGKDIVVVYRVYHQDGLIGSGCDKVSCKSLINGKTYDLALGINAHIYELNRVANLNEAGLNVNSEGLQTSWDSTVSPIAKWIPTIIKFLG